MTKKHTLKKIAVASVLGGTLLGGAGTTLASYQAHAPGPLLTYGKTTQPSTILSIAGNPANGHMLLSEGENHRMGYFSSLGVDVELGEYLDEVDELLDLLDEDNVNINTANAKKTKFEALLPQMGESARFTLGLGLNAPFMPFAVKSDLLGGGVLSLDVKAQGLFDVRFLDAPIIVQTIGGNTTLETDSSVYVKGGSILTGSLGYSREVWKPTFVEGSTLYAGVQANIYQVSLNKQVIALSNIEDGDGIGDAARDEFDENTVDTTAFGLDFGLLWTMDSGQLGITFANINEPEFDYGDVGKNCGALSGVRQANCYVAQNTFSNEINLSETAVMNAQTTVEGALFTENKQWILSAAVDMNSVYDLVGRETQYISASANYFPDSYIIPSVRLGIHKNLTGSELTTVGFGTTLFGIMNIDLMTSLDTVEYDGTKAPRQFGFNIGFEEKF